MCDKKYWISGFHSETPICPVCGQTIGTLDGGFQRAIAGDYRRMVVAHINCCKPNDGPVKVDPVIFANSILEENRTQRFYRGWSAKMRGDVSECAPGRELPPGAIPIPIID